MKKRNIIITGITGVFLFIAIGLLSMNIHASPAKNSTDIKQNIEALIQKSLLTERHCWADCEATTNPYDFCTKCGEDNKCIDMGFKYKPSGDGGVCTNDPE